MEKTSLVYQKTFCIKTYPFLIASRFSSWSRFYNTPFRGRRLQREQGTPCAPQLGPSTWKSAVRPEGNLNKQEEWSRSKLKPSNRANGSSHRNFSPLDFVDCNLLLFLTNLWSLKIKEMHHCVWLHQQIILALTTLPFTFSCTLLWVPVFKFCQTVTLKLSKFMADQVGLNSF